MQKIVVDPSVLVAAFRSRRGASVRLLARLGTGVFETAIAVPLVFEYEDALTRDLADMGITQDEVGAVVDYVCRVSTPQKIFFLWRPVLRDPGDDLVLEIAVAARCGTIVTHNVRDFDRARPFGVRAVTPGSFLDEIEGAK